MDYNKNKLMFCAIGWKSNWKSENRTDTFKTNPLVVENNFKFKFY